MHGLADHQWRRRFSSSLKSLLEGFYKPALMDAVRYWRIPATSPAAPCSNCSTALSSWWPPRPMGVATVRCG
jgi:hypothetical protein